MDDIFVIIESDMVHNFLAHINNIETSIKFTIEYEKDKLSFLNVMSEDGILATKIYRKEIQTNHYLNYLSCHLQQQNKVLL